MKWVKIQMLVSVNRNFFIELGCDISFLVDLFSSRPSKRPRFVDKTNSANRDRRPIGGKLANKKFKNKNKGRKK